MPGSPAGQPFCPAPAAQLRKRSLSCQVGCMHLPKCHPRDRAMRLDELRYSRTISGRAKFNGCLREKKLYNQGFPLKSTGLQKALLPLLLWLVPFCSQERSAPATTFPYKKKVARNFFPHEDLMSKLMSFAEFEAFPVRIFTRNF